jgi:hypothetical protein
LPSFNAVIKTLGRAIQKNSPAILTAMGVAGTISTAVLAVKGTPQALRIIEEKEHNDAGLYEKISNWEKVKATYPCYIPAASVAAVTITCIIAGNSISTKRNAAIMSLYSLTETGFREYQDKVIETIGAQKEQKVRDEVAQDRVRNNPVSEREVIIIGGGNVLCYDSISGRYFMSDVETIRRSVNDINEIVLSNGYASQNDFYAAIGLPRAMVGEELGWTPDNMLNVEFSAVLAEDGKPCMALNYRMFPTRGYYIMSDPR